MLQSERIGISRATALGDLRITWTFASCHTFCFRNLLRLSKAVS